MRINKKTIIGTLLAVVFLMSVVYSTFSSSLTINGVADVMAKWDVHIKSITAGTPVGSASVKEMPFVGADRLSATFSVNLYKPGDSLSYTVVVENDGNLDASLNDIVFNKSTSDVIDFTYSGIAINDRLNAGESTSFTINASYKDVPLPPSGVATSNVSMILTYVQAY